MESYATSLSDLCCFSKDYQWTINESKDLMQIFQQQGVHGPEMKFNLPENFPGCQTYEQARTISWKLSAEMDLNCKSLEVYTEFSYAYRINCGVRILLSLFDDEKNKQIKEAKLCQNWLVHHDKKRKKICSLSFSDVPNHMKICCQFQAFQLVSPSCKVSVASLDAPTPHCNNLAQRFQQDCKEGQFTDAVLKFGDKKFNVHKLILRMQSDFFKTRFDQLWEEKEGNVVDMNDSDLDSDLLQAMVTGAYTGEVADTSIALKLLPVVDKYQFNGLKQTCERMILSQLKVENAISCLILAEQHKANKLKKRCIELCISNLSTVKSTSEWKELMTSEEYTDIKQSLCDAWLQ